MIFFPVSSSLGNIAHLHPMMRLSLAENFLIQFFSQELSLTILPYDVGSGHQGLMASSVDNFEALGEKMRHC